MNEEIYEVVKTFPKFSEFLNSVTTDGEINIQGWCENIKQEYSSYVYYDIENICPVVIRYLTKLKENTHEYNTKEGCNYLYYWLYEKAHKNNADDLTFTLYKSLLSNFGDYQSEICTFNVDKITGDIFQKLKDLYNLYDHFDKFQKKETCNSSTCNCAQECVDIYNKLEDSCSNDSYSSFCIELDKFGHKYNEHMKDNDTCEHTLKSVRSFRKNNLQVILLPPISIILVISFILFILYKYTPFPSWLLLRIKKNKRTRNYLNDESYQLLHNDKSRMDNSQNEPYNIEYHSVHDS
ncbi:PIR Superfamily Protein [Plasmodium ovale wallikeri]|uniref:PIR Superfamily Protein n=1 Tax=Plasmodium ovale wallikeri TaxID=864142 RepID=A0A1A8YNF4_PLAOA|nr:PIR Superfamily Protein [Plasmodium ovale wallikeri]SBT58890.1 PIR Superfamily Protein [Plasmodium ovale wallikeri]